jgi:hypothetical protein
MQAVDAFEISKKLKSNSYVCEEKVTAYIDRKIQTAASLGKKDTICKVPILIQNVNFYDINTMVTTLIQHLRTRGFYVIRIGTNNLYVSWRYPNLITGITLQ